jgi:hypothetical protein
MRMKKLQVVLILMAVTLSGAVHASTRLVVAPGTGVECQPFPNLEVIKLAIKVAERGVPLTQEVSCTVLDGQKLPVRYKFIGDLKEVEPHRYSVVWRRLSIPDTGHWLEWEADRFTLTTEDQESGNLRVILNDELNVTIPR